MEIIVTTEAKIEEIFDKCLSRLQLPKRIEPDPEVQYFYSIKELAKFLNCSPVTAQKLKNSGKIRYKQFGRKCVFNTIEVLEDLNNGTR
jgi:excisionase family DNA binding protein